MPAERRDSGGQFGDLIHSKGHASFVVGIETYAAYARSIKIRELLVRDIQVAGNDCAGPSG